MEAQDYKNLPSIKDIASERLQGVSGRIVLARMSGTSLRDVALEEGLSRYDSRQFEREALNSLFTDNLIVREDYYKYIYERYDLGEEFYLSLDSGTIVYYYLKNRYNPGFGTAVRAVEDKNIPNDIVESLRSFFSIEEAVKPDVSPIQEATPIANPVISTTPIVYSSQQLPEQIIELIDDLWSIFITSGITKPTELLEQVSIFLLLKKLDDDELQNMAESFALGISPKALYFDSMHQNCRWSYFHNLASNDLYSILINEAVPFIRNELWVDTNITVARYIKNIHLKIKDANLLLKIVSCLDSICGNSHISLAQVFDSLSKKAGTSYDIAKFVYKNINCSIEDTICCPYMDNEFDSSSFAIEAQSTFTNELEKVWHKSHFTNEMFTSYSTDNSLLLISSMRMLLNGIASPIYAKENIATSSSSTEFSRVVASIPAKLNMDRTDIKGSICSLVGSSNSALICMYACHEILSANGICALLVPHKALSDTSSSHTKLHEFYLNKVSIIAIVYLPKENKDILIYKNSAPASSEVTFAKLEDYSIENIQDISQTVSYEKIKSNKYSLNYLDYFEIVSKKVSDIVVEDYDTVKRRIFDTEFKIDSTIKRIKSLLEELS